MTTLDTSNGTNILLAVRDAVWSDYLHKYFSYEFTCDIHELLLGPRNILRGETQ